LCKKRARIIGKKSLQCRESEKKNFPPDNNNFIAAVLGKRMRVWERRLMKDFQVASAVDDPTDEINQLQQAPEDEDVAAKWKRIARLAVLKSAEYRWTQVCQQRSQKLEILFLLVNNGCINIRVRGLLSLK
jgi:hypothetical protein